MRVGRTLRTNLADLPNTKRFAVRIGDPSLHRADQHSNAVAGKILDMPAGVDRHHHASFCQAVCCVSDWLDGVTARTALPDVAARNRTFERIDGGLAERCCAHDAGLDA
jgi:hypothetical protein